MSSEGSVRGGKAPDTGRLKLFISYSRADLAFADELTAGLEYDGAFEVAIDRHSIIEGEDWKKRLGALIADADTIVFLLSPKSAASDVCKWEVDEAVRLTKRIVPVLVTPLGSQPAPPALAALNYVRFDPLDDGRPRSFMAGLTGLVRALKSDLGWLREHTRLLARASEWAEAGRPGTRLLTGDAVSEAKAWAARRPKDAPALNALHLELLAASEQAETARLGEAAQVLAERERLVAKAEQALDQQRAALRASARMQRVASGLIVVAFALLGVIIEKEPLSELWFQQTKVQPYIATHIRGHLLSTEGERNLKPGDPFRECDSDCPEMVVVPAGSFLMGSPDSEKGNSALEGPVHPVKIAKPFAVGKFTVTWDEWEVCVRLRGCDGRPTEDAEFGKGNRPVINVTWDQAQSYVAWLARMTGKGYRLLTEAEWEYAARGVTSVEAPHPPYPWGDDPICNHANLADMTNQNVPTVGGAPVCVDVWLNTAPVGSFPPNAFGLHDMQGNVMQWVQDSLHLTYYGDPPSDGSEWKKDGDTSSRIVRGGSWLSGPVDLRSANRFMKPPVVRAYNVGFRVARTLSP